MTFRPARALIIVLKAQLADYRHGNLEMSNVTTGDARTDAALRAYANLDHGMVRDLGRRLDVTR